jgi:predicted dehydrogenase
MPDRPLSLGFVGGAPSSAAGHAHFSAVRMDGLWSLDVGAFSADPERNVHAAAVYGVDATRAYDTLNELLQHEASQLDAIVLLTPTPLHYEMTLRCLAAGMPVICEKALATSSVEAIEIAKLQKKENGFLSVIYNYSGYPMVRELRRMIRDGVLGEVLHFQAEMPQEGYLRTDSFGQQPKVQDWRLSDKQIPTLYLDLAVHLHELIFYLTEESPLEVVADQYSRGWFDVIDNVSCLVRYTNDVRGHYWFSKCALGHRNGLKLRVYGRKASAEWLQLAPEELQVNYQDGRKETLDRSGDVKVASEARYNRFKAGHPSGFIEALANLYVDIHAALIDHKQGVTREPAEVYGADLATEGLKLFEAMTRSCSTGQWESI